MSSTPRSTMQQTPSQREGIACPWCGAQMNLRRMAPGGQQPDGAVLICSSKPGDHTIRLSVEPALRRA